MSSSICSSQQNPFSQEIIWKRAKEIFVHPVVFSEKGVTPCSIKQGVLGDYWFVSALATLAEEPSMVKRLFLTTAYSEAGFYRVKICKNGCWQTVTIDDYFPCF